MKVSVVIRTRNEADRLRLTLQSLQVQTVRPEIVVVDDGSSDHTPAVLGEALSAIPLTIVTHGASLGRSAASNAGARRAKGDVLLFLDGDTLGRADLVERHLSLHRGTKKAAGRGETFHLRKTRFLKDPEEATPQPGQEERLARMKPEERNRLRVTADQIRSAFQLIDASAEPGIYPGAGPRRLYELEMDALQNQPDCRVLWAAASGSNFSIGREMFEHVGGFDSEIDMNEHRELALRLCQQGVSMRAVPGARSYHLTHRAGWRDPLKDLGWEKRFLQKHPISEVRLLSVFWASLSDGDLVPAEARIQSLPELAAASRGKVSAEYEAIRLRIHAPDGALIE